MTAQELVGLLDDARGRVEGYTESEREAIAAGLARAERMRRERRGLPLLTRAEIEVLAARFGDWGDGRQELDDEPTCPELDETERARAVATLHDWDARKTKIRRPLNRFADDVLVANLAGIRVAEDERAAREAAEEG